LSRWVFIEYFVSAAFYAKPSMLPLSSPYLAPHSGALEAFSTFSRHLQIEGT